MCISLIGLQMTPLHWSVKSNAEIISLLIDAGAQLEAKEEDGVSTWVVMVYRMFYAYAS